jgi:hypothetical protein
MGIIVALFGLYLYTYNIIIYFLCVAVGLLDIIYFWNFVMKKAKENNFLFLLLNSLGLVISVIVLFAAFYFVISSKEPSQGNVTYNYPSFSFSTDPVTFDPCENYIHIPHSNYKIDQYNNVSTYTYYFSLRDAVYYSFTTYFTVGFGDYYPCGEMMQIISIIEMIVSSFLNLTVLSMAINGYLQGTHNNSYKPKHLKQNN